MVYFCARRLRTPRDDCAVRVQRFSSVMLALDTMWHGRVWYGFIEVILTSTTDVSLLINSMSSRMKLLKQEMPVLTK